MSTFVDEAMRLADGIAELACAVGEFRSENEEVIDCVRDTLRAHLEAREALLQKEIDDVYNRLQEAHLERDAARDQRDKSEALLKQMADALQSVTQLLSPIDATLLALAALAAYKEAQR